MGRRRKHDGDLGLASDQIPGQNQNNIRYQALSLSAVAPPGLSQRYGFGLYRTTAPNCKSRVESSTCPAGQYAAGADKGRWENRGTACKLSKYKDEFPRTTNPTSPNPSEWS